MQRSFYEILGVESDADGTDIRRAYKVRLLEAHPDKNDPVPTGSKKRYSVNEIQLAYQTLIKDNLRKEYDEQLSESFKKQGFHNAGDGLDTFSLDLFRADGSTGLFSMDCPRCGMTEGFQLTEDALEEHAIEYEGGGHFVLMQCSACSLWIKVLFDVVEEE